MHQTGPGSAPKHIVAQKLDAAGSPLWGASPVAVFDGGSLQFGTFPTFVPDGSGGGVFSWYDVAGSSLQSYVQRLLPDGTEAFVHNGIAVSTDVSQQRVSPEAAFDRDTETVYVFWTELSSNQAQQGVYGQKVDVSGVRRWTDTGVEIEPLATAAIGSLQTVLAGAGASVFWSQAPSFGQGQIFGATASGEASSTVDVAAFDVSTTPASKSRLMVSRTTVGFSVLAWQDDRSGTDNVYAQSIGPDGTLAPPPVATDGAAPEAALRLSAQPNPSSDGVRFEIAAPLSGPAEIVVYDVLGRSVWTARGEGPIAWDGRALTGERVPSGVYLARLTRGSQTHTVTLTVAR